MILKDHLVDYPSMNALETRGVRHNPGGKSTVACSTTAAPPAFHANLSRIASAFVPCCEFVTSSLCVTIPFAGIESPEAARIDSVVMPIAVRQSASRGRPASSPQYESLVPNASQRDFICFKNIM